MGATKYYFGLMVEHYINILWLLGVKDGYYFVSKSDFTLNHETKAQTDDFEMKTLFNFDVYQTKV